MRVRDGRGRRNEREGLHLLDGLALTCFHGKKALFHGHLVLFSSLKSLKFHSQVSQVPHSISCSTLASKITEIIKSQRADRGARSRE